MPSAPASCYAYRNISTEAVVIPDLDHGWGHRLRKQWQSPLYQLKIVFLLLIILIAIGVTFYRLALRWDYREALLQIIYIFSTLGGSVRNIDAPLVQWFNIFYILTILLVVIWGVSLLIEAMVQGELVYFWGTHRMEQRITQLSKHFILCGFGRMGQEIAQQLTRAKQRFVIIEHNPAQIPNLEDSGYLYVQGDAREDEELLKAGIKKAKGLIAVYSTDEENVFITLSARVLNPALYVVTRSSSKSGEAKMKHAGADRVF